MPSTDINREKTENHDFALVLPLTLHVARATDRNTVHTLAHSFLYTSVLVPCPCDLRLPSYRSGITTPFVAIFSKMNIFVVEFSHLNIALKR